MWGKQAYYVWPYLVVAGLMDDNAWDIMGNAWDAEALKAIEGMDGVKFQASVLTICSNSGQMCVTLRGSKPYHP